MSRVHRSIFRAPRAAAFLLVALAACGGGGDGGGGPDVGTPAHIDLVGTVPATAVNAVVTPAPRVKVTDDEGRGVPNVSVTFTAVGGGTIASGVQKTNAEGVATAGEWRLGTVAGSGNALVATAGSLSTVIAAVASAGPASLHVRAAGQPDSQIVAPSATVPIAPSVRVTDQYGNPVQGVVVTFAPGANSGTVTGGLQTTNANGVATVGSWTVSGTTGRQTLVATATGGLPSVTFVANVGAGGDPNACVAAPYTLGATVTGTLTLNDCPFGDGSMIDLYGFTSANPVNHDFRLASTAFDAFLVAYAPVGTNSLQLLGYADDESQTSTNARLRLIAPPGSYIIGANAYPDETGAYTFSSSSGARAAGCDLDTWAVPGATWTESIASTDCAETTGAGASTRADVYWMGVPAGRTVTVTMRSTAIDAYLRVLRATDTDLVLQGQDDNGAGGTDARLTFTAPTTSATLYAIVAMAAATGTGGAYTLEVSSATAATAATAALRTTAPTRVTLPLLGPRRDLRAAVLRQPWAAPARAKR